MWADLCTTVLITSGGRSSAPIKFRAKVIKAFWALVDRAVTNI